MSILKRLFSGAYRKALEAEARGDHDGAARAYALAGEEDKVAEMNLLRAEQARTRPDEIDALRAALRWCAPGTELRRKAERRLAGALADEAKQESVTASEHGRKLLREAAALYGEAGLHGEAGECLELSGDDAGAAKAYAAAGLIEKMELTLARDEQRDRRARRLREAFDQYQLELSGGDRELARSALKLCVDLAAAGERRGEYVRLLEELDAKRIGSGLARLTLVAPAGTRQVLALCGASPVRIGREPDLELSLRGGGVSRLHAELWHGDAGWRLRDAGSRNGTRIRGRAAGGRGAAPGRGAVRARGRLGDRVAGRGRRALARGQARARPRPHAAGRGGPADPAAGPAGQVAFPGRAALPRALGGGPPAQRGARRRHRAARARRCRGGRRLTDRGGLMAAPKKSSVWRRLRRAFVITEEEAASAKLAEAAARRRVEEAAEARALAPGLPEQAPSAAEAALNAVIAALERGETPRPAPGSPELAALVDELCKDGHEVVACERLERLLVLSPKAADTRARLCELLAARGELARARPHLELLADAGRGVTPLGRDRERVLRAHLLLGEVFERERADARALRHYEAAMALDLDYASARQRAARLRARLGQTVQAPAALAPTMAADQALPSARARYRLLRDRTRRRGHGVPGAR